MITFRSFLRSLTIFTAALFLIPPLPALARETGRIFVSNERSHTVWVFSPEFEHIATIETSRRPRDMKLNGDRTLLYVACGDDDVIDIIDVETLEIVDRAYILHEGRVLMSGTPDEVVNDGDVRRVYLGDNFKIS